MNAPFASYKYTAEVISPIHIGAAKESDYMLGQDYFYDKGVYCFVNKRPLFKAFTNQQIANYSNALANNNLLIAAQMMKDVCNKEPNLIYRYSECKFGSQESIKKHICDGFGKLIIPGSSIKGAIRSILGVYLMGQTQTKSFDEKVLFGNINNNLMRLLQVGDISFDEGMELTPMKIYSGDLNGDYETDGKYNGIGKWKNGKHGGHVDYFTDNLNNFVTIAETLVYGTAELRINWADALLKIINTTTIPNTHLLKNINGNNWLTIAQIHTEKYLLQEIDYFKKFKNDDFFDAVVILENLLAENNEANTALLRIGAGSGFHAITGNWQFENHIVMPFDERTNALKYKTRKIGYYADENGDTQLAFPGYLKISVK